MMNVSNNTNIMTQEDKDLLLKDLCARLPYKVICCVSYNTADYILYNGKLTPKEIIWLLNNSDFATIKPYLRPMSSMTDEEYDQLYIDSRVKEDSVDILDALANDLDAIDWLNKHHFDYRGLIERGLAIEVTEKDNPYKK